MKQSVPRLVLEQMRPILRVIDRTGPGHEALQRLHPLRDRLLSDERVQDLLGMSRRERFLHKVSLRLGPLRPAFAWAHKGISGTSVTPVSAAYAAVLVMAVITLSSGPADHADAQAPVAAPAVKERTAPPICAKSRHADRSPKRAVSAASAVR